MLLSCAKLSQIHHEICSKNWNDKFEGDNITEDAIELAKSLGAVLSACDTNPTDNLRFDDGVTYTHAKFPDGSWSIIDHSEILYFSN